MRSATARPAETLETDDGPNTDSTNQEGGESPPKHPFWCSVRMTFVFCAFLAMTLQLCMRNSMSTAILCMTPGKTPTPQHSFKAIRSDTNYQCSRTEAPNDTKTIEDEKTQLGWTREQGVLIQGTFYWGYAVTMPFAGRLSDRFGGKLFLIISVSLQAFVFMMMPISAKLHYYAATVTHIIQGTLAGFCVPAIYQLFTTWAHPTERTVGLTIAFAGFSIGTMITMPISSYLCTFGWYYVFYIIGGVSLAFGLTLTWLIYNKLEDHPRITREEFNYLQSDRNQIPKDKTVPWKEIIKSVPVYALIITHFFHTYGVLMQAIMLPRFLQEALKFSLSDVGNVGALVFIGPVSSKIIIFVMRKKLETPSDRLTKFRRYLHIACCSVTIALVVGILFMSCYERWAIICFWIAIVTVTDFSFAAAYWPSILYIAPPYAGLLTGIANCIGTTTGFIIPQIIASVVKDATEKQWKIAISILLGTYAIDAIVFGCFGSFKLQPWAMQDPPKRKEDEQETKTTKL